MKNARLFSDFQIDAELEPEEIMRVGRGTPTYSGMGLKYKIKTGIIIWDYSAWDCRVKGV